MKLAYFLMKIYCLFQNLVKYFTSLLSPIAEVSVSLIVQEQILGNDLRVRWAWNVSGRIDKTQN